MKTCIRNPIQTSTRRTTLRLIFSIALFFLCSGVTSQRSLGGLVPNEVVLVVNAASLDSRTLANHYIKIRNLPASNVIVLDDVPNSEVISVVDFRAKILGPLLAEMDRRKLGDHVQCIAYSADFPTAIDIQTDIKPLGKLPIYFTARASINAATYFYMAIQSQDAGYIRLDANAYARRMIKDYFGNPLGKLTEDSWTAIQEKVAKNEHKESAALLVQLFEKYPSQFPLAYMAAAEYAVAKQTEQAIDWLEKTVAAGWTAGGYLMADERFAACRDDSRYQLLLLSLDETQVKYQPSIGFDCRRVWAPNGVPSKDLKLGSRYLLSTVLGVTRGAGTSLEQAIDGLSRAAAADWTQPDGGFYFCLTSDVRTTTREPGFDEAITALRELGFEAELLREQLPKNKPMILGAMIGTPNFDWSSCGSSLLPGSIAENLTSVGATMNSIGGQTKLTEFIKAGAAGSCGTVTEPYALQAKFPHPQLYVHYARGLSLAESFYASVTGPYQLLIIGDPLCQPFAAPPQLAIDTQLRKLAPNESLRFPLKYKEAVVPSKRPPVAAVSISIVYEQAPVQSGAALVNVDVKLEKQSPGYHEVRVVCAGDDALTQRSETVLPIWIGEENLVTFDMPESVSFEERTVAIKFAAKDAKQVTLWHESEQIDASTAAVGEFEVPLAAVGLGPVRLHVRAELPDGKIAASQPQFLQVNLRP